MDHMKILKRALRITWEYRALWLVGLLLVIAGGSVLQGAAPSGNPNASSGGDPEDWEGFGHSFREPTWQEIAPFVAIIVAVIVLLFLFFLLFGLVAAVVRPVTRVSLVRMVDRYEESGERTKFLEGLRQGWSVSAFWLWVINLILSVLPSLLVILVIIGLVVPAGFGFAGGRGPGIALGVGLILLVIPVVLVSALLGALLGPITHLAHRVCVLEERGPWESIKVAFGLIRRNLGAVALQWLLLVGLRIACGIAMIPVNILLLVLWILVGGLPALLVGGLTALLSVPVGVVLGLLVLIPMAFVIFGVPNTALSIFATVFHSTTWTLTYRELKTLDEDEDELDWPEEEELDPRLTDR